MQSIATTSTASQFELTICRKCKTPFPITHFRLRRKGEDQRHTDCRSCHSAHVQEWRKHKISKQQRKQLSRFATAVGRAQSDDQIRQLMDEIIDRFGGTQALAEAWVGSIKSSLERPGTRVLKSFEAIVILIQHSENHPEDFSHMSLEDIHSEKLAMTKEAILENPAIALYAAQQLGWTVIPPTETLQDAHS